MVRNIRQGLEAWVHCFDQWLIAIKFEDKYTYSYFWSMLDFYCNEVYSDYIMEEDFNTVKESFSYL